MDLALDNQERLICQKSNQPTNQPTDEQNYVEICDLGLICLFTYILE